MPTTKKRTVPQLLGDYSEKKKAKKKPKLHTYVVTVVREVKESCTVEVKAKSDDEAEDLAIAKADDSTEWETEDMEDMYIMSMTRV